MAVYPKSADPGRFDKKSADGAVRASTELNCQGGGCEQSEFGYARSLFSDPDGDLTAVREHVASPTYGALTAVNLAEDATTCG